MERRFYGTFMYNGLSSRIGSSSTVNNNSTGSPNVFTLKQSSVPCEKSNVSIPVPIVERNRRPSARPDKRASRFGFTIAVRRTIISLLCTAIIIVIVIICNTPTVPYRDRYVYAPHKQARAVAVVVVVTDSSFTFQGLSIRCAQMEVLRARDGARIHTRYYCTCNKRIFFFLVRIYTRFVRIILYLFVYRAHVYPYLYLYA
jgi:hypothetical protein